MNEQKEPINFEQIFSTKTKKKNGCLLYVLTFIAGVLAVFIIAGVCSINDKKKDETSDVHTTESPESEIEYDLTFFLTAGMQGEYGKTITYNEGTEFEEIFFAYYVPYGKYMVKNVGDYPTQVNAYSDQIVTTASGWEEPAECYVITLKVGETKELTVPEGWHVEISEPTIIQMQRIDDIDNENKDPHVQPSDTQNPKDENSSYTIVDEYYYLSRSSGLLFVNYFCIVKNTGNTNLSLDYSEFEISNKSGTILDVYKSVRGLPVVIAPGETGVYQCDFSFYHSEYTEESYQFVTTPKLDIEKTSKSIIKLETSDVVFSTKNSGYGVIRGNIANNTSENLENCKWIAFLHNEEDKIIGVVEGIYFDLDAGRNMNFDGSYSYNIRAGSVKRCEVIAIAIE
jgi:hypothetical protein